MGLSLSGVSKVLGIAKNTAHNYSTGKRQDMDNEVIVPKHILLACSAIEKEIPPID